MGQTILMQRPRCPGKTVTRQVPALRACALCMHSAVPPGAVDMACLCPTVIAIHGRTVTALQARAGEGACGPDAHHLDMHSWQAHQGQQRQAIPA